VKPAYREIIKGLIQIVWADGTVDDREREILGKMLAELDLTQKDLQEVGQMMTQAPELPDLNAVFAQGHEEKSDLMKVLLALAMSRGHLNPPELRYIQAVSSRLEISKDELEQLKQEVRKLPEQKS
jgi:uncharacterized tellurite resistance protein B-like protein